MSEAPEGEPSNLKFLRRLVTILMGTMIVGFLVLIALLVMRFSASPSPPLPEEIVLPDGVRAAAVTVGDDWYAVLTTKDRLLVYDTATGTLRREIAIRPDG